MEWFINEIWIDIQGYEGLYKVSNFGRVKSIDRYVNGKLGSQCKIKGKIMKLQMNHKGYPCVVLHKNCKANSKLVHRLVAIAFIPNPDKLPQVNHKDTNKQNNHVSNLEWITNEDNMRHAFANGCFKTTKKQIEHAIENQIKMARKRKSEEKKTTNKIIGNT